ncbi:hypothetical protein D9M71_804770 [compost metagenome]
MAAASSLKPKRSNICFTASMRRASASTISAATCSDCRAQLRMANSNCESNNSLFSQQSNTLSIASLIDAAYACEWLTRLLVFLRFHCSISAASNASRSSKYQ